MLNLKSSTALIVVLIGLTWLAGWPAWVFVLLGLLYLGLLVTGSIFVQSQFYTKAVCRANTSQPVVALSFDDGPHPIYTRSIIATLSQANIPATFFFIGKQVAAFPELAQQVAAAGFTIGNHSYSHHTLFDLYSAGRMKKELEQTNETIRVVTGKSVRFFRPPYGVTNPNLARAIKQTGLLTIGWNLRSMDTVTHQEEQLLKKIGEGLQPGGIILLHDTMAITATTLHRIIDLIHQKGYQVVPLEQMINEKAYA